MKNKIKGKGSLTRAILVAMAPFVAVLSLATIVSRGCDNLLNNRTLTTPTYQLYSKATGLSGHKELVRYINGSQSLKIYPGFGHRLFDSRLYDDFDGDGKVDRIMENGSEIKMHRLNSILTRAYDYTSNKEKFDKGDEELKEMNQERMQK